MTQAQRRVVRWGAAIRYSPQAQIPKIMDRMVVFAEKMMIFMDSP